MIVSCQCTSAEEEICSWIFFQNGALGLEIENLSSDAVRLKASFTANNLSPEYLEDLRFNFMQAGVDLAADTFTVEQLADQNWMNNWKKYFEPFTVGNSFIVCPPWREAKLTAKDLGERKKIIIDPGMAFGTGQHATTKFCLQAIENWAKGPRILDIGTGSSILAIACAMLFQDATIWALDIDDQALENARHNIKLNNLEDRIKLFGKSPSALFPAVIRETEKFDTLLSNLTVEDIISLLPTYDKLLNTDGVLILAGIIETRLKQLEDKLVQHKFKILEKSLSQGWVGIALIKSK